MFKKLMKRAALFADTLAARALVFGVYGAMFAIVLFGLAAKAVKHGPN